MNVGILGCGTMGGIIAANLQGQALVDAVITTRRGDDNAALAAACEVIVLCIKPSDLAQVASEISPHLEGRVVISIAARVTRERLRRMFGERCTIVRAMPNTPCRIGQGVTLFCADAHDRRVLSVVDCIFGPLGITVAVNEQQMDAATAVSGCGPAFIYEIIEALCDGAVKLGVSRELARRLTAHTMLGAARLVLESGTHPLALQDEVATPGGCTIDGLLALRAAGVQAGLTNAILASGGAFGE